MTDIPETNYAKLAGAHIAYQVIGEGPPDIVLLRLAMNNIELQWEEPRFARFLTRLASFSRLIVFDARGLGVSDPLGEHRIPTMDDWSDDIQAVMDAAGSERAAIVSLSASSMRSIPFVASHPERVSALVVVSGSARLTGTDEYGGRTREEIDELVAWATRGWGREPQPFTGEEDLLTPAQQKWINRYRRLSASPGMAALIWSTVPDLDIRHVLDVVSVPTLVIDHEVSQGGTYIADHIRGAERVRVPGHMVNGWPYTDPDAVAAEIERFLGAEARGPVESDRILATVLFTDVVESTRGNAAVGDARWRDTLDALDRVVADEVGRHRGRVIKFTGDGHLATFDVPGRAIRCGVALGNRVAQLGLTLRTGLHTGEIEVRGEDIGGIAVSIARRVCDAAEDGAVFVSSAVPPLVAGSPIDFDERGEHELKGVPGRWVLYSVKS